MVIFMFISNLASCGFNSIRYNSRMRDDKLDEIQHVLVTAITNKDEKLMKSVLSSEALNSADLQDGIQYCFELLDGNVIEIEKKGCMETGSANSRKVSKMIEGNYIITTEKGIQYYLRFEWWYVQEHEPDKLGVNVVELSGVESENSKPSLDYNRSGIYNPQWDEDYWAEHEVSN